jgi:hypothetical protein
MADVAKEKGYKEYLNQLEGFLDDYLINKAPKLPTGFTDFVVKFLPFITIIFIIIALPFIFAAIGLSAFALPATTMMSGINGGLSYLINLIVAVITIALEIIALPGLFKTEKRSWTLIYYSMLISGIGAILTFSIASLIITILFLYVLFQIKSSYTK